MSSLRCEAAANRAIERRFPVLIVSLTVFLMLAASAARGQGSPISGGTQPVAPEKSLSKNLLAKDSHGQDVRSKDALLLPVGVIVERMMAASARRSAQLRGYRGIRNYRLQYRGILGTRDAAMQVAATYNAPNQRSLTLVSQSGSKLLLNRVLLKLLDSEKEAYRNQKQVELSPANYEFQFLSVDASSGNPAYVLGVKPRQDNKFLYRGKIWVDAQDFAVVRMEGEPAKSPSFWIKDTQIDVTWQKVGNFWLTQHNTSLSHIRLGGMATLTIDYTDYQVMGGDSRVPGQGQMPSLPDPSSVTPQR